MGLSLPRAASLASPRGAVRELGPRERREGVRVFAADGAPHPAGRTGETGHAGDVRGDARVERRDAGHLLQEPPILGPEFGVRARGLCQLFC